MEAEKDSPIFIDGSFNNHYLTNGTGNGSKSKRTRCDFHKTKLPYREYHAMAETNEIKGIHQKQCEVCLLWLYPEEF